MSIGAMSRWRAHLPALALIALALAASATSLGNGFAYDDVPVIHGNDRVHSLHGWWRLFGQTYWPPYNNAGLYRPITMLGFAVQWTVGGGAPWVFHAANVLLYIAVCLVVYRLAVRLLPAPAAWIAAALFAVHPVHVEVVGNIVGQAELLAALFVVAAVDLYVRTRERGPLTPRAAVIIGALYVLACLSKEHGIVLPALLLAAELTLVADRRSLRERARELRPLMLGLAALGLAFIAVRTRIIGDLAGASPAIQLADATYGTRLLTAIGAAREWGRLLLWPARLAADYSPPDVPTITGFEPALIPGALVLTGTLAVVVLIWRRSGVALFGMLWIGIALLPYSNLIIPTSVLVAERTLFLPSVGLVLALGVAAHKVAERLEGDRRMQRLAAVGLGALLAAGALRSAWRQPVWKDSPTLFAQNVKDAPFSYRAHYSYGMQLFKDGDRVRGEQEVLHSIRLFPRDPMVQFDLARMYRRNGLCAPAKVWYRRTLQLDSERSDARVGLIVCLLKDAEFAEARHEARVGLATGYAPRAYRRLLSIADSAIAAAPPRAVPARGTPERRPARPST